MYIRYFCFVDPTEHILGAAFRDGLVLHKDDLFLIHGPGGVGKSSIIDMFLGKTRDLTRNSTQLATEPLHFQPVRDVSTLLLTGDWQEVDYKSMSRMVAHTSDQLRQIREGKMVAGREEREREVKVGQDGLGQREGEEEVSDERKEHDHSQTVLTVAKSQKSHLVSRFASKLSSVFKKSLTTSLGDDPDNIEGIFESFQQSLHDFIRESGMQMMFFLPTPYAYLTLVASHSSTSLSPSSCLVSLALSLSSSSPSALQFVEKLLSTVREW